MKGAACLSSRIASCVRRIFSNFGKRVEARSFAFTLYTPSEDPPAERNFTFSIGVWGVDAQVVPSSFSAHAIRNPFLASCLAWNT